MKPVSEICSSCCLFLLNAHLRRGLTKAQEHTKSPHRGPSRSLPPLVIILLDLWADGRTASVELQPGASVKRRPLQDGGEHKKLEIKKILQPLAANSVFCVKKLFEKSPNPTLPSQA